MRALVIYVTDEGQTRKIANHIAIGLLKHGIPTDQYNIADERTNPIALDAYDAVVVGSSIHYSHYDASLARYITRYQNVLNDIPSAFFSVSLGILSPNQSEQVEIQRITDAYLVETGWHPEMKQHFAGALAYSKYNWIKRRLLHWIARQEGTHTDMRRDYEFTDWHKVDEFVDEFAEFTESCKATKQSRQGHSVFSRPTRKYSVSNRHTSHV